MTPPTRLCNRSFIIWLIASGQSQFGSAMGGLALSFLVLHQTGQAGAMALTLAFALGPNLLMPLAGAWVDRVPLKVPLIAADLLRGALVLTVALIALRLGNVPLWVINGSAFLGGMAGIFASPASGAAFPALVPESELARANALQSSVQQGAGLLGTLLGGLLVARLGPPTALLIDGLSFLVMAGLLPLVRLPGRPPLSDLPLSDPRPSLVADLGAGLRLMGKSKLLSFAPPLSLLLNGALVTVTVLTPKLMDELGAGPGGYGLFTALEGVGALIGGAVLAGLGSRVSPRRTTAVGLVLCGSLYLVMARFTTYPALLACSLGLGLSFMVLNAPLVTLVQRLVPAAFRGRVFAVLGTASSLGMPVTLLCVSPLLDRFPASVFYGAAGLAMLLGCLGWVLIVRSERALPDLSGAAVTLAAD